MPLSFNFDKKEVDKYRREESDEEEEEYDDDDGDEDVSKLVDIPQTPKLVLRDDEERENLTPDLEENVCRQTGHVMDSFFASMNSRSRLHDVDSTDVPLRHTVSLATTTTAASMVASCSSSFLPQFAASHTASSSVAAASDSSSSSTSCATRRCRRKSSSSSKLKALGSNAPVAELSDEIDMGAAMLAGQRLAVIADEVNERYASEFQKMIGAMKLTPGSAYHGFAAVARKLFSDGTISWGRITILFLFGYRIAISVLRTGFSQMIEKFVACLVEVIIREKITRWIAQQGGWRALLRYVPESLGWPFVAAVFGLAGVTFLAACFFNRFR